MRKFFITLIALFVFAHLVWAEMENIKIGVSLPLSRDEESIRILNAYEFAAQKINAENKKRHIELIVLDNLGSKVQASKTAISLIKGEKVLALIGGWSSDLAVEIAKVANKYKTPYILDHPISEKLTNPGSEYVFRICPAAGMYFDILGF